MNNRAANEWRHRAITTRTLADLECKLEMRCRSCHRTIVAEACELRQMFPIATPIQEVGPRLRCKGCGASNPRMWIWIMGWTRDKRRRRDGNSPLVPEFEARVEAAKRAATPPHLGPRPEED
jgi:hypothetical protein